MRKTITILAALSAALLLFSGCAAAPAPAATQRESDIVAVSFDYAKQQGYATNQFAVWIEDANGVLVKTLFATEFTANGGYEKRPDAIPVWVERAAIAGETTPDAASGATPKSGTVRYFWDLTDESGVRVTDGTYKFFVEGTLRWKNNVLFSGELTLNGSAASADATAAYTYLASDDAPALTAESPENTMISGVKAEYIPLEQP